MAGPAVRQAEIPVGVPAPRQARDPGPVLRPEPEGGRRGAARGRTPGEGGLVPTAPSLRRTLALFGLGSLVPLLVLLVGVVVITRHAAGAEALRDAERATDILAEAVVEPALTDEVVAADPAALDALDRIIRERVLVEPRVRVKLWTMDGRIVYSDERQLIGDQYALSPEQFDTLRSGRTVAEVILDDSPENTFESGKGPLLEVYRPVVTPGGEQLLFETYSRYAQHSDRRADIRARFLPIAVGALLLFALCQLPLVSSLVRRLQTGQEERERLLVRASHASETERRRIAADIHDTVVQSLVGAGYVVAGTADDLERTGSAADAARLRSAAAGIRESTRGLRSLLVQVYPPDIARAGLPAALADLLAPLRAQGVTVRADVTPSAGLPLDTEALLFRVAQEALRNVARHAGARTVDLTLVHAGDRAVLEVADDGVGFVLAERVGRADGHVGLRVLQDLVNEAGGDVTIVTGPGQGTRVRVEVPL